ncbi:Uncharacterised protein [Brucella anthropi]|nr:hypothetical protein DR92_1661 [Brucella anthropi]SUA63278.1 Uncharacterised protein [Brucella anthropi]
MTTPAESSRIGDKVFGWVVLIAFLVHRPVFRLIEDVSMTREELVIQLVPRAMTDTAAYACRASHAPP